MTAKEMWAAMAYEKLPKHLTDYSDCNYLVGWLAGFDFAKSLIADGDNELGNGPFPYKEYLYSKEGEVNES